MMPLKVCFVVGDNQSAYCGVKDYAVRLAEALGGIGINADVAAPATWTARDLVSFVFQLRTRGHDIVHLQYPSIGNRASLYPLAFGLMRAARGALVTLHEHSSLPASQRLAMHLFRLTVDRLLFTTEFEASSFGRAWYPGAGAPSIIPIGSNVPVHSATRARAPIVLYFGQIRPNKGLEEFLELARRSVQLLRPFRFLVLGSVPERQSDYLAELRAQAPESITWRIGAPSDEVAEIMAGSLAAYLPFPDGASYRRSSLLAALANELPVVSTVGRATPLDLAKVLLPASSPGQALTHLDDLHAAPARARCLAAAGCDLARRLAWPEIARRHLAIYEEILDRKTRPHGSTH